MMGSGAGFCESWQGLGEEVTQDEEGLPAWSSVCCVCLACVYVCVCVYIFWYLIVRSVPYQVSVCPSKKECRRQE